jgi:bacteriocin biosynthesis cyclodehydratase domain-containing protein
LQPRPLLLLFPDLLVSALPEHPGRDVTEAEQRPLLAPWWRCVADGGRLLFEHAGQVVELNGRAVGALLPALVPLLDGTRTTQEIVDVLGKSAEPAILRALSLFEEHGLLVDGPPTPGHDEDARYVAAVSSATPAGARSALTRARVAVRGAAAAGDEVARLLASAGVATTAAALVGSDAESADLVVVAPAPEEAEHLPALNARRLSDATPWLALLPSEGSFAAVGPLFVPGQTACHACFLLRRGATSGFERDYPLLERQPVRAPMPPAASTIASGLAALICLRWLGAHDPTLPGVMYALELRGTLGLTRHRVLRVPRCPACSPPSPPPSPWFRELDAGAARQPGDAGR